jgi:GT2 family glycosyltransferase
MAGTGQRRVDAAQMRVAVLIVNWNGGNLLDDCLASLERQTRRADRVIVVDNGSSDDSLARAGARLRDVEVLRLSANAGFARANNIAARAARDCDGLALLNPDAVAEPGWLAALVNAAEREPDVAAFASQMRLASAPAYLDGAGDSYHVSGRAWRNGHRTASDDWPAADIEVFAPCAAAALYRRAAFEDVGGFDEQYFCYFEDVDLGFRLRLRGCRSLYVHDAVVHHVSSALSGYRSDFAVYHGERNAVWTFVKNMPAPLFWKYLPQHVVLNLAALVYYPWRGQGRVVFRAKIDAIRRLGAILKERKRIQRTRRTEAQTLGRAMCHGIATPYRGRYSGPRLAIPQATRNST